MPITTFDHTKFPKRLNPGCGFNQLDGYFNIDLNDFHEPDLVADIRDLSILPDGYYEEILAQDVLEHIERTRTTETLAEWNRLLKRGGILKLRVPSLEDLLLQLGQAHNRNAAMHRIIVRNLFGTQNYTGDYHLTSFTDLLLRDYLETTGFEIARVDLLDDWLYDVQAVKRRNLAQADDLVFMRDYSEFLQGAYRSMLGREPDEEGFSFYLERLQNGEMSREAVIEAFAESEEARERSRTSFVAQLVAEKVLLCPACRSTELQQQRNHLECLDCRHRLPIRNQVPDFFNQCVNQEVKPAADPEQVQSIAHSIIQALELQEQAGVFNKVLEIVRQAHAWSCENTAYTAEINDLLDRFVSSPQPIEMDPPPSDANGDVRVRFERHYFPSELLMEQTVTANVRVTNLGESTWSSRTPTPLALCHRWCNTKGERLGFAASPTWLPIDIVPGRSISLPVRIQIPQRPGNYRLDFFLALGEMEVTDNATLELSIHIQERGKTILRRQLARDRDGHEVQVETGGPITDYGEDHLIGIKMVENALREMNRSSYRVLEVGSATHPHTAFLPNSQIVALDISSPLLELGSLCLEDRFRSRLAFICADAFHPPFRAQSFDVIALFSALHHFAEPEKLLERLVGLLKPNGIMAVMCEPVAESLETQAVIRDLLKGINEQVFSVAEYCWIFAEAGLQASKLRLDGGSLKAILTSGGTGRM